VRRVRHASRLFGTRCAKCQDRFARNDLVMRAKSHIFHLECFHCVVCGRQLVSGDQFALRDDLTLVCQADHQAAYVNNNNCHVIADAAAGSLNDDVIVSCAASNNNNDVDTKTGKSRVQAVSRMPCAVSRTRIRTCT